MCDDAAEAFDDLDLVVELAAFDVDPVEPVAPGEDGGAGAEGLGSAGFVFREWADGVVGGGDDLTCAMSAAELQAVFAKTGF